MLTKDQILNKVRSNLRLTDETIWTNERLRQIVDDVVSEVSNAEPLKIKRALPIISRTRDIDISGIVDPTRLTISACDSAWTAKSNVTCTADTAVKREGSASAKCALAAGFTTGLIATTDFAAKDLSRYDKIHLRIRSSGAQSAGVLQLCLDNTAVCASPLETLDIPAVSADTWYDFYLDLVYPSGLTAVISVGLNATADPGAVNIWLDKVEAIGVQEVPLFNTYLLEYPVGNFPPKYKNYARFGDVLSIALATVPEIEEGTLTGTLTFIKGSRTVTGTGTIFITELDDNYFIRLSAGSRWYCIAYIESDTELALSDAFGEDSATDVANSTLYRDESSCAILQYGTEYLVTDSRSNLPSRIEAIVVLGVEAKATSQWSGAYIQAMATSAMTAVSSAEAELDNLAGLISQATDDLSSGRSQLGADIGALSAEFSAMTDRIGAAVDYLEAGDDLINIPNPGGKEAPRTLFEYARTDLQAAQGYIDRIKAYLSSAERGADYSIYAKGELDTCATYINSAAVLVNAVQQRVDINQIMRAYNAWVNGKMTLYQTALASLGRVEDDFVQEFPIE